jgi:Na+:H+ antiporter, NhaA family
MPLPALSIIQTTKLFYLINPFQQFLKKIVTGGVLLICSAAIALLWANLATSSYHHFWHTDLTFSIGSLSISKSMQHWIDEALMTLFFFTVGLEIKREILIGELAHWRRAILPIAAAAGGMIVPALIYLLFNINSPEASQGWGIPMATDIAFALAALSLISKRIPFGVKIFLSALAIVDDIGAVLVIAIFYTKTIYWQYLVVALAFLLALGIINLLNIKKTLPYAILGIGMWFVVLGSGIHATVAGVIVAFFIPAKGKYNTDTFIKEVNSYIRKITCPTGTCGHTILLDQTHLNAVQAIEVSCRHTLTPLQRLEHSLNSWVALIILPLFALANGGVVLGEIDMVAALTHPVTMGVSLGLIIGKPIGIFLFTLLASKTMRAPLSKGVTWFHIGGASILAGIGFTMSIFISGLSFPDPNYLELSKFGIMIASMVSASLGLTVLYFSSRPVTKKT